jgi:hypothetical protein
LLSNKPQGPPRPGAAASRLRRRVPPVRTWPSTSPTSRKPIDARRPEGQGGVISAWFGPFSGDLRPLPRAATRLGRVTLHMTGTRRERFETRQKGPAKGATIFSCRRIARLVGRQARIDSARLDKQPQLARSQSPKGRVLSQLGGQHPRTIFIATWCEPRESRVKAGPFGKPGPSAFSDRLHGVGGGQEPGRRGRRIAPVGGAFFLSPKACQVPTPLPDGEDLRRTPVLTPHFSTKLSTHSRTKTALPSHGAV